MKGIFLRKLEVVGIGFKPASITFSKGLNLISGPSNTGKSYIFECINYMLGGNEKPESFKENKGYTKALLEFESKKGILTLERELNGGNFNLYNGKIDDIATLNPTVLRSTHEAGSIENLSGFLLDLSGFSLPNWLKKNQNNKKQSLSFRNLKNYITISEERIITKESLIHSGQNQDITLEKSLLKLLVTGNDDKELEEIEKPEIKKAKLLAKLDVLDELIGDTKQEIKHINLNRHESVINDDLSYLKNTMSYVHQETDKLNKERKVLWDNIKLKESKCIHNEELLKRFNLLEEQYLADVNRLEFIDEGAHYFNQLNVIKCPNCGCEIHNHNCSNNNTSNLESMNEACNAEINKIKLNLSDLRKSKADLQSELKEIAFDISSKKDRYDEIVKEIEKILEPKSVELQNKLDSIMEEYRIASELETLEENLNDLMSKHEIIENSLKNKNKSKLTQSIELEKVLNESNLKDYITSIFNQWQFEDIDNSNNVLFDKYERGKLDISISGKRRKGYGKGFRALIYSSFVIALMEYCYHNDLPHPGFVIIDSPVTTFHDIEHDPSDEEEEVPLDTKNAFFNYLSTIDSEQVIILENEQPEEKIKKKINYIEFTKDSTRGRYGFF
ncbi:hypothetical protein RKD56_004222 [Priestia megaterium]